MEKIKIITKDLEKPGSRVLGTGTITDKEINYYGWGNEQKELNFVVAKGFINDWCIYLESMEEEQDIEQVRMIGNKIHGTEAIKLLVDCSDEVLKRYRQ